MQNNNEHALKPIITIIIPVYNSEMYIKRCLDSIVNQTLSNIEIMIIDDGSTDSTNNICDSYAKSDNRITLIKQSNQKQGAARNVGLRLASGKYVGFVDSDDFVDLNYFETLINAAESYNADIVMSSLVKINGNSKKYKWKINKCKVNTTDMEKFVKCSQKDNLAVYNKIYLRDFVEKHNLMFPENVFYEDGPFTIRAIYYSNKLVTVPNVNYYYIKNSLSTVNSMQSEKHKMDAVNARKNMIDFIRKNNIGIPFNTFHFTLRKKIIFNFILYLVEENIKYRTVYLFGMIPIYRISGKNK